jgi:hypothetical protein
MVGAALEKKFRGSKFREQLSGVARAPPANDDARRLPASISSSSWANEPLSMLHTGRAMALDSLLSCRMLRMLSCATSASSLSVAPYRQT